MTHSAAEGEPVRGAALKTSPDAALAPAPLPQGVACWALTAQGAAVARQVAAAVHGTVYAPQRLAQAGECGFASFGAQLAACWSAHTGHVCVAATGIVVRCMAPLLRHKTIDPAVVVCDQRGRFAVSLLAGHLGGANALAHRVAACLGAQAVITTATDCEDLPALDVLAHSAGCAFADVNEVKTVSAAMLAGEPVQVWDPLQVLGVAENFCGGVAAANHVFWQPDTVNSGTVHRESALEQAVSGVSPAGIAAGIAAGRPAVSVTLAAVPAQPGLLRLHPRLIYVGVGCRRGVAGAVIEQAIRATLAAAGLSPLCVAGLASASIKTDEPGLHEAAHTLGADVEFFSGPELAAVPVPHPSVRAGQALGLAGAVGVCEGAAVLAAGLGHLLVPKQVHGPVTVALAVRMPSRL